MGTSVFRIPRLGLPTVNPAGSSAAGIMLGVLAYALFSVHDAVIKWLVTDLPAHQILFVRSAGILAVAAIIGRRQLLERAAATPLKGPLLLRGAITLSGWLCYYSAARWLSLAQLLCLYYAAPLMVTAMAIPLLRESVSRARWLSVLIGFASVMVVTNPWALPLSWPTILVLLAAAQWAYAVILMRQIARSESSLLQILFTNLVFVIATGIACAFSWHPPDITQTILLLLTVLLGGLGQFSLFEAARHAAASVMASVEYTALIWAFLLGYEIWSDIPPVSTFAGAGMILAAGVFLFVSEWRSAGRLISPR
jgi:drug/metabolite transporter (DMT)-like permease